MGDVFGCFYDDHTAKCQICDYEYRKSGSSCKSFMFHDFAGNKEDRADDNADRVDLFFGKSFLFAGCVSFRCSCLCFWLRIFFFYDNFGFDGSTDLADLVKITVRILCGDTKLLGGKSDGSFGDAVEICNLFFHLGSAVGAAQVFQKVDLGCYVSRSGWLWISRNNFDFGFNRSTDFADLW